MKKIKPLIVLLGIMLVFSTCDENDPAVNDPEEEEPEPTMVGLPNGIPVSKTIGSAGGVVSIEGKVEIEIPAGALSADTEISIQPITNNAPNGKGDAYRFEPEGIKFNKPVKLTLPSTFIDASQPPITGIAFQDTDRIWYSSGKFEWDTTNKTVSTQTTHFSDWATFDVLVVRSKSGIEARVDQYGNTVYQLKVNVSEEFQLFAVRQTALVSESGGDEAEATPLAAEIKKDNGVVIKEWFANGVDAGGGGPYGTIKPTSDGCTYTAPPKVPATGKNPVSLSVILKGLLYKDPTTGEVFQNLQVATDVKIIGELKFDLVVTFHSTDVVSGGLIGATFTLNDEVKMRIVVDGDSVTSSNIVNSPGIVTPSSKMDPYGNSSTCTSTSTYVGPLDVELCNGLVNNFTAGKPELWLTLRGLSQTPSFDWVGATGGQVAIKSEEAYLMQIMIFDLTQETPSWETPGSDILSAKLTRVE